MIYDPNDKVRAYKHCEEDWKYVWIIDEIKQRLVSFSRNTVHEFPKSSTPLFEHQVDFSKEREALGRWIRVDVPVAYLEMK